MKEQEINPMEEKMNSLEKEVNDLKEEVKGKNINSRNLRLKSWSWFKYTIKQIRAYENSPHY